MILDSKHPNIVLIYADDLGYGDLDWNGQIKPGPLDIGFDYCFVIPAADNGRFNGVNQ